MIVFVLNVLTWSRNDLRLREYAQLIPAKRKATHLGEEAFRLTVSSGKKVRTAEQEVKRRRQNAERNSTRRATVRANLESIRERSAEEIAALVRTRLKFLDDEFTDVLQHEEEFPPELPDMKTLYTGYYNQIMDLTKNLICASCGCIDHDHTHFENVSVSHPSLRKLQVDPSLVPFPFGCGVPQLDNFNIMIDPLRIVKGPSSDENMRSDLICRPCQRTLGNGDRPAESLANYRWIGPVPS